MGRRGRNAIEIRPPLVRDGNPVGLHEAWSGVLQDQD